MRIYKAYWLLLLLAACGDHSTRRDRLVHRRVFVITDTAPVPEKSLLPADTSYLEYLFANHSLVDVQSLDSSIRVKLRYADTSNFLKKDFYDGLRRAYLPCEVALRLCNAQQDLKQVNPQLSLLIWDAAWPLHLQQMMWDSLDMEPDRKFNYLSPPYEISLHNYGCAVDLTIVDLASGQPLDMGTDFDAFTHLSQPAREWKFVESGELSREALDNRRLLRYVMKRAGFNAIPSEWWHFGYGSKETAAAKFKLIK